MFDNILGMAIKDPQYSSSAQPCGSGQQVVYAWALNAPELELPDNVGFRVGGPDSEIDWLVLQVSNFAVLIDMIIVVVCICIKIVCMPYARFCMVSIQEWFVIKRGL